MEGVPTGPGRSGGVGAGRVAGPIRIRLHDAALYNRDMIRFSADDGTACTACWLVPAALPADVALFPVRLAAALAAR